MTQISRVITASNKAGVKRTLAMPVTVDGYTWQVTKDTSEVKGVWSKINHFNSITIFNQGLIDLWLKLDHSDNKKYFVGNGTVFSIDSVMFQGFDLIPDGGNSVQDKIIVHAIYERPLLREEDNKINVGILGSLLGLLK